MTSLWILSTRGLIRFDVILGLKYVCSTPICSLRSGYDAFWRLEMLTAIYVAKTKRAVIPTFTPLGFEKRKIPQNSLKVFCHVCTQVILWVLFQILTSIRETSLTKGKVTKEGFNGCTITKVTIVKGLRVDIEDILHSFDLPPSLQGLSLAICGRPMELAIWLLLFTLKIARLRLSCDSYCTITGSTNLM